MVRTQVDDHPVFHRHPQRIQYRRAHEGNFVQEEHPMVGEANRAGFGHSTAAD